MKRNRNFRHKKIATLGCPELESFITLMKESGWTGGNGYDGNSENSYYYIDGDGRLFFDVEEDRFTIVCATDFIEWYQDMLAPIEEENKKEKTDAIKVTREEFKKIYDVACEHWKEKLAEWCNKQTFNDKLEFTHREIQSMIDASTERQLPIVKEVFHGYTDAIIDLRNMQFKGEVFDEYGNDAMIAYNICGHNSFYLNDNYTWELSKAGDGNTILIPTKK
jgi:hypothetical protein